MNLTFNIIKSFLSFVIAFTLLGGICISGTQLSFVEKKEAKADSKSTKETNARFEISAFEAVVPALNVDFGHVAEPFLIKLPYLQNEILKFPDLPIYISRFFKNVLLYTISPQAP